MKYKMYVDIPLLNKWRRTRITDLPLIIGINFNWYDYDFSLCQEDSYFPKGRKEGKHIFTINIGITYFSIRITLYKPKV